MHYKNQIDEDYPSRPLLPTDEETLSSKILNSKVEDHPKPTKQTQFDLSNLIIKQGDHEHNHEENSQDLSISKRSVSNRNMNDLLISSYGKFDIQKALTDTSNFIEIFNRDSKVSLADGKEEEEEENISLSSIDKPVPTLLDTANDHKTKINRHSSSQDHIEDGMTIDPDLKKRRDEWADKGAAKIIKNIVDPKTGEKSKKLIKKGIKDFKFGDIIGDGAYSTVKLATAIDSGKKYAVKILDKAYLIKQKKVKYVNIEKNALQRVNNSQSIIKLYFTFQDESSLYFLLEYAPNGDLLSLLKKYGSLNENAVRYFSAQIIDAIDFLHLKGIIHRDIKPENILLDNEYKIKLTDFGTAKLLEYTGSSKKYDLLTRSKSFVGTAEYVSPELLNDSYVDYRCDIWAFGCILFQMIAGRPPFKATNEYLTFQKVMKVQYAFTAGFPTVIRDLVKRILIKQIDKRLTIPQIKKHHFYKDVNFKDGSVWSNPVPELSAYKVTAKSMQPIPELKGPVIFKRPQYSNNLKKSTSALPSAHTSREASQSRVASTSSIQLMSTAGHHATNSQDTNSSTTSVKSTVSSNTNSKEFTRKKSSEKTSAILKNAMKTVEEKRLHTNKRIVSGSSYQNIISSSNISLSGTNSSSKEEQLSITIPIPSSRKSSVSTPTSISESPFLKLGDTMSKSNPSANTPKLGPTKQLTHQKHTNSASSTPAYRRKSKDNSSTTSISNNSGDINTHISKEINKTKKTSLKKASPTESSHHPMNKHDIQWSNYLKSVQEHVLQVQEMYLNIVDTAKLDRKLSKYSKRLTEPSEFNYGRSTLLSQVVRSGGDITGFRYTDSHLPEAKYYSINHFDENSLPDDYRQSFEFLALILSDENTSVDYSENSLTPTNSSDLISSEDPHNGAFSGKFKKFFQQAKNGTLLEANSFHERFQKRMVVVTSFGRLLVCVRNQPQLKNTSSDFNLVFDIDLCQIGVEIKEIIMKNQQNNMLVIQTPYKSFILCNLNNSLEFNNSVANFPMDNWFKILKKSITSANEKKIKSHHKDSPQHTLNDEQNVNIKNKIRSPNLTHKSKTPKVTSPKIATYEKRYTSPKHNESKHLFSNSIKATNTDRNTRIFESYVNSREKHHKKHTVSPIPTSSKLVNGLPSTSASALLGLGLSLSSNVNQERQSGHLNPSSTASSNTSSNHNSRFSLRY